MKDRLHIIVVLICTFAVNPLIAQDLPGEQVEVIKNFDARLLDARKIRIRPQLPPLDSIQKSYAYNVSVDNPTISYPAPVIRPLAIRPEKAPMAYNGSARVGYGFPNSLLAEVSYVYDNDDDLQIGLEVRHTSADDKDVPLKNFSDNDVVLHSTYFSSPSLSASGRLSYSNDKAMFYGTDPTDFTLYLDEGRRYKSFAGEIGIGNTERLAGDINYHASFGYINHQDDLATRETSGVIEVGGEKWINGRHPLALTIIADLTTLKDTAKRNLNNFFLQPNVTFRSDQYKVTLGANIATHSDTFFIFPEVLGSVKLIGNQLIAFAGANGTLRKNNFFNLSTYNPFIHERITSIRNTETRSYFGGVKGRLKIVEYEGKLGYVTNNDLALYLHASNDSRKFQPVYDDVNIVRIEGTVRANPMQQLEVGGTIGKNFYSMTNEDEPWHLPGFEARVFATYKALQDKLRIKGDLFVENGVPYIDEFNRTQRLNSLFDISLGADYFITEHIGAFVQANNLAANKRQRWLRYPTYGVNIVGGVLVRI